MVLVPEKQETAESNWEAPSSMQVVQVDSVSQAYQALMASQSSIAGNFLMVSEEHTKAGRGLTLQSDLSLF